MKKTVMIMAALLFVGVAQVYGQSFKDLLNKGKDVVGPVVEQLDVIPKNIEGNWEFSGSAVKFTGDNVLMNAASELAAGKVENQLNEYLQKVGIRQGLFSYVFNADGTFTTTFSKMNFSGQYTFSQEEGTIELDYGKNEKLKGVSLKTDVSVSLNSMQLLFNADKLLDFISKITSTVGDSKIGALASLIDQYDGLKIGFELSRVK